MVDTGIVSLSSLALIRPLPLFAGVLVLYLDHCLALWSCTVLHVVVQYSLVIGLSQRDVRNWYCSGLLILGCVWRGALS